MKGSSILGETVLAGRLLEGFTPAEGIIIYEKLLIDTKLSP
jgi:hypothetical protein